MVRRFLSFLGALLLFGDLVFFLEGAPIRLCSPVVASKPLWYPHDRHQPAPNMAAAGHGAPLPAAAPALPLAGPTSRVRTVNVDDVIARLCKVHIVDFP